ncbi:MAG: hypothetical protein MO852_09695 [Candidatus Devosia euplotis]|nr:hypothetical protein [Candidatus Devosia euplotis]
MKSTYFLKHVEIDATIAISSLSAYAANTLRHPASAAANITVAEKSRKPKRARDIRISKTKSSPFYATQAERRLRRNALRSVAAVAKIPTKTTVLRLISAIDIADDDGRQQGLVSGAMTTDTNTRDGVGCCSPLRLNHFFRNALMTVSIRFGKMLIVRAGNPGLVQRCFQGFADGGVRHHDEFVDPDAMAVDLRPAEDQLLLAAIEEPDIAEFEGRLRPIDRVEPRAGNEPESLSGMTAIRPDEFDRENW